MELEPDRFSNLTWRGYFIRALLIIAAVAIMFFLVKEAQADMSRSIYDGEWTIRYTDCQGILHIYEEVTVLESGDVWITFRVGDSGPEIKLPVRSNCNEIIMIRLR